MPRMPRLERCGAVWTEDFASPYRIRKRATLTGSIGAMAGPRGRPATSYPSAATTRAVFGNINAFSGDLTLAAWVYVDSDLVGGSTNHHVFQKWVYTSEGYSLRVQDGNASTTRTIQYVCQVGANHRQAVTTGQVFTPRTWHHIAATHTGSTVKLYLDGVAQTVSSSVDGPPVVGTEPFKIGSSSQSLIGGVAEAQAWDRVLSDAEIAAIANPVTSGLWTHHKNIVMRLDMSQIDPVDVGWAGKEHDGTGTGLAAANIVKGPYGGYAIDFNGTDEHVAVADSADLRFNGATEDFSVVALIRRDATGAAHNIMDKRDADNDGWRFIIAADDKLYGSVDTIDVVSSSTIAAGGWHTVGFSVDRDGNGQIFIDGVADGSAVAINSEVMDATAILGIASQSPTIGAGNRFNGVIADARIYAANLLPIQHMDLHTRLMRRTA